MMYMMETVVDVEDEIPNDAQGSNIIIDLDKECNDDIVEIIDVDENNDTKCSNKYINKLAALENFIQKCFTMDCSPAMLRVINRTLLPLYKSNKCQFFTESDSQKFDKALNRAICNLASDPLHRFSHVKDLCDILRQLKIKPKESLPKKVKKSKVGSKKRRKHLKGRKHVKRLRIDENVINIDDDEFEVPIVDNYENVTNCSMEANEKENTGVSNVPVPQGNEPIDKQYVEIEVPPTNPYATVVINDSDNANDVEIVECTADRTNRYAAVVIDDTDNANDVETVERTADRLPGKSNNCLLEIHRKSTTNNLNISCRESANAPIFEPNDSPEALERQIETFKKMVDALNAKEVTEDNFSSPYVQCEYYQKKIVKLYERLCRMKGRPSVKRREVRLRAIDSRPELPMRKLENLINSNIGKDGLPHFPDMEEVITCVKEANHEANLGWDNKQVMAEARALFVHCGRALQSKRQKREWRDLMSMVQDETLEDPADKDPELAARLNMNRLIAKSKEIDIFEKYTSLSYNPPQEVTNDENSPVDETDITTNEDDDVRQIRIVSVACGVQGASNITSENCVETCSSELMGGEQEIDVNNEYDASSNHLTNTENNSLENLCDTSNKDIFESVSKNVDEPSEGIPLFNSKKSTGIQIVCIETIDDFDTNNNEDFTNTEDFSKDSNKSVTDIAIDIEDNVSHHKQTTSENVMKRETVIEPSNNVNTNLECAVLENTAASNSNNTDSNHTETSSHVLQIKRKSDGGTIITYQSTDRQDTSSENIELNSNITDEDNLLVKTENTLREIREMGDNFTVNILNVIDPFLIVEVSSDSSSDEEDEADVNVSTRETATQNSNI